jgi:hypothetical protein
LYFGLVLISLFEKLHTIRYKNDVFFVTIKAILPHSDVDYEEVYLFVCTYRNMFYGVRCPNNEHICTEKDQNFNSKAENRGVVVSVCAPAHLKPPVAKRKNIKPQSASLPIQAVL